jgi:hypothetical protein
MIVMFPLKAFMYLLISDLCAKYEIFLKYLMNHFMSSRAFSSF